MSLKYAPIHKELSPLSGSMSNLTRHILKVHPNVSENYELTDKRKNKEENYMYVARKKS